MLRVVAKLSRCGMTHDKLQLLLKYGAVLVLIVCIIALTLSWFGFGQAHNGFYDALDSWAHLISTVYDWVQTAYKKVHVFRDGVDNVLSAVDLSVSTSDVSPWLDLLQRMLDRLRQIQEDYENIRGLVDTMFAILFGAMIFYSVVIAFLCCSLPVNAFVIREHRWLPLVQKAGFFLIGILVCITIMLAVYLAVFFNDFCDLAEVWFNNAWTGSTAIFDIMDCDFNSSTLVTISGNTTELAQAIQAEICNATCGCTSNPVSECAGYSCNGTACAAWVDNATVVALVNELMTATSDMLEAWLRGLACWAVFAGIVVPLLSLCENVPDGLYLMLAGSALMAVAVALGIAESLGLSNWFQSLVRDQEAAPQELHAVGHEDAAEDPVDSKRQPSEIDERPSMAVVTYTAEAVTPATSPSSYD